MELETHTTAIVPILPEDTENPNFTLPILIVENEDVTLLRLSVALREAGIPNPLIIRSDMAGAIRYLDGHGVYSDREKHPLPGLLLLDVTLPELNHMGGPSWLTPPPVCRQIVVADFNEGTNYRELDSAAAFGPNAVVCKVPSADSLVHMFEELRRSWMISHRVSAVRAVLRAA
jgi:hypothetical protein